MIFLSFRLVVFASLFHSSTILANYNEKACCQQALDDGAFIETSTPTEDYRCGQYYDASLPPAPDLLITYSYCTHHCSGIGLSKGRVPGQWAALIVQFLLPAVIFSMTIPRQQKIEVGRYLNSPIPAHLRSQWLFKIIRIVIWVVVSIVLVVPLVVFDSVIWISTIISAAGPMMIGGLYEALLDSRLLGAIRDAIPSDHPLTNEERKQLLVAVVSGNLMRDIGRPQTEIPRSLATARDPQDHDREIKTRLLSMMSSQYSFGSAVGAPVLFYLGAFVYSILDLDSQGSNQDAAISLAFGVEWMIIVHVAIVSGCLLASNNPATSAAIVGLPPDDTLSGPHRSSTLGPRASAMVAPENPKTRRWKLWLGFSREDGKARHLPGLDLAYETRYQPVWLWSRGSSKMDWIRDSSAYLRHEWFRKSLQTSALDWILFIFSPVFLLIVLPPAAGGIVAYTSPPVGWGCRSLTLICYAGVQVVLTFIAALKAATKGKNFRLSYPKITRFSHITSVSAFVPILILSFLTSIGGTLMQITGVFRNCFCYVTAQYWLNPHSSPGIHVSSDTSDRRISSHYWVIMSSVATGFMALISYIGWWYQREIRQDFIEQVKELDFNLSTSNHNIYSNIATEHNASTTGFIGSRASLPAHTLTRTNTLSSNPSSRLTIHESTFGSPIELEPSQIF